MKPTPNFEPLPGQKILVSDETIPPLTADLEFHNSAYFGGHSEPLLFVGMNPIKDADYPYIAVHPDCTAHVQDITKWKYAAAYAEPTPALIPWNVNTCPLPPFTVKHKTSDNYSSVMYAGHRVELGHFGSISYQHLLDFFQYIPDETNRSDHLPCGIKQRRD